MNSKMKTKVLACALAFILAFADVALLGSGVSTAISTRIYQFRRTSN